MNLLLHIRRVASRWFQTGYAAGYDDGLANGRIREREGR